MNKVERLFINTDSYKYSHHKQYPKGTKYVNSYIESRGSENDVIDTIIPFGLQAYIVEYISDFKLNALNLPYDHFQNLYNQIESHMNSSYDEFNNDSTKQVINEEQFNELLDFISKQDALPLYIEAVPEGIPIPTKQAFIQIRNTQPQFYWLPSFIETSLLRAIWYPTTVATLSYRCEQLITKYLGITSDSSDGAPWKLHDFGARGVSSFESAQIGGAAHLIKFVGSDTFAANAWINDYYPAGKAKLWSSSIPAAEHSTVTSHGRAKEAEAYKQIFEAYDTPLVAIVSDSYDIFHAVKEVYGVSCKPMLDAALGKKTLVIRPDSGDPVKVCIKLAHIICDAFGYTTNSKGYKVFPDNIRLIQGDGVNYQSISDILCAFVFEGISTDMIAFGMGGELLQKVNRDTLKFAMKCSAININGDWAEVYKQPVGDTSKHSKRGILKLIKVDGQYKTINTLEDPDNTDINQMIPMYWDKPLYRNFLSFDEVRLNSGFNAPF